MISEEEIDDKSHGKMLKECSQYSDSLACKYHSRIPTQKRVMDLIQAGQVGRGAPQILRFQKCINPNLAGLNRNIQNRKPILEEKSDPLQKAWQNVLLFTIF
jgi:hypothetical protein